MSGYRGAIVRNSHIGPENGWCFTSRCGVSGSMIRDWNTYQTWGLSINIFSLVIWSLLWESQTGIYPPLATRKIIKLNGEFWSHVWLLGNPQGDADLSVLQKVSYRWPFADFHSFPVFYDLGWLQGPPHSLTPCPAVFFCRWFGTQQIWLGGTFSGEDGKPCGHWSQGFQRISARWGYERIGENDMALLGIEWWFNGETIYFFCSKFMGI